ncbi:MAG: bifunctional diguanylate cyclase/phosphodiesterase [Pseudomonadota bacterium]
MQLERFLQSFARMTQDNVVVIHSPAPGVEGTIVWCNDALCAQHLMREDQLLGQPISILFDPHHYKKMVEEIRPNIIEGTIGANSEALCVRRDGTTYWGTLQILYTPRDATGGRLSAGIIRDISELKEREAAAAAALEQREVTAQRAEALSSRLALAIDSLEAPMGIWNKDRRLVICNKAFGPRLMGRDLPTEPDIHYTEFVREAAYSGNFPSAAGQEETWIEAAGAAILAGDVNALQTFTDGRTFLAKTAQSANGDIVVHNYEMTEALAREEELSVKNAELKKAEQTARHRANRDELTGLGNRRYIGDTLAALNRQNSDCAVLQIDLDRFKPINDTLGHAAGDHVLMVVGARLTALVGPDDHLGRIGGDEFVIICDRQETAAGMRQLGDKVVRALTQPIDFKGTSLRIGASVGIATTPLSSCADLLVHADVALYRAKAEGRGTVRVFDHTDLEYLRRTKAVGDEILTGLDTGQFVPWYQPQVDAVTGAMVGLEALARWNHPEKGILPPSAFVQHADDLNVLHELDRQIFETAVGECRVAFRGRPAPDLSVNVSEERLMRGDVDTFLAQAARYPGKVSVELLETIFMDDRNDRFLFQIDRLREAGIGVHLDDFGSGRASIVALEQIAPDWLKIDRRLVHSAATSAHSARLLRAIIDIGEALGIRVTAEGVETTEQVEVLRRLGCDRLQGYYFGKPMPLSQLLGAETARRCAGS